MTPTTHKKYLQIQHEFDALRNETPKLTLAKFCEMKGYIFATVKRYVKVKPKARINTKLKEKKNHTRQRHNPSQWTALLKEYFTLKLECPHLPAISFAKAKGLSYNSFRREMSLAKLNPELISLITEIKSRKENKIMAKNQLQRALKHNASCIEYLSTELNILFEEKTMMEIKLKQYP